MDEPTGNLDTSNAEIIINLLLELVKEEGVSLIVATHDLSLAGRLDATLNLESS
jgi:lipoprotein-releasing system ATP-binding protein